MIWIASDHAGFDLKEELKKQWPGLEDLGCYSKDSVDYPDYADRIVQKVLLAPPSQENFGILVCGSGQGMAIRANRFPKIRAALCWNTEITKLSRQHNNANVLCLPGRYVTTEVAMECLRVFAQTPFEGGRHTQRVDKLSKSTNS